MRFAKRKTAAGRLSAGRLGCGVPLVLVFTVALGAMLASSQPASSIVLILLAALSFLGMAVVPGQSKSIKAGIRSDPEGKPHGYTLNLGAEQVTLDPGKLWTQVDRHKWVTRGLIEEPQSFHIQADGTVEINEEKIPLADPDGAARLEREVNRRHSVSVARKPPVSSTAPAPFGAVPPAVASDRVQFKVKLDHLGHLMIECIRGAERTEIGLRGIAALVQAGMMLKPRSWHLDPLQRSVEIDGVRFECSGAGARLLEQALNAQYAPRLESEKENAIEIRENPASATGFDIRFQTLCGGTHLEVKGHLTQEHLDVLQEPAKCELLRAGTVLRLVPPLLLIRRRRPDGGEESIAELPDIPYRRVNAMQLQQLLNHPLIRKGGGAGGAVAPSRTEEPPVRIVEMQVTRNPQNKYLLWIECVMADNRTPEGRAFTHHNLAEFRHQGVFRPQLDVALSVDNRTLTIRDQQTHDEQRMTLEEGQSSDADLVKAGAMLTAALKPAAPHPIGPPSLRAPVSGETIGDVALPGMKAPGSSEQAAVDAPVAGPPCNEERVAEKTAKERPPNSVDAPSVGAPSSLEPDLGILAVFREKDPVRVNIELFRHLRARFGVPVQEVRLSLPCVFENRLFEVISFAEAEISTISELRSESFFGFYLSHINERKVILLYACKGMRVEWGTERCLLQATVTAEPSEYRRAALLGMAQDQAKHFVFVVEPDFKDWVKPHEKRYAEAFMHMVTPRELAAGGDSYTLVWPERASAPV